MAESSPNTTKQIPSAAQRYYAQPRVGNVLVAASTSEHHQSAYSTERNDWVEERRTSGEEHQVESGSDEKTAKKWSKARREPRSTSVAPLSTTAGCRTRQSARLIKKRAAALENVLRDHLLKMSSSPTLTARKKSRRLSFDSLNDALPTLSEDPTSYGSNPADCRFHLPLTIEDRFAVRAALTPTLFRLQKKGWHGSVVWNLDASYMEAYQKCLQAYFEFELSKRPNLSPFELPSVLALLPWYGRIRDFRNSPNWPNGW